ncbi:MULTISPECIES: YceO family protein [unclassified Kosakonia]
MHRLFHYLINNVREHLMLYIALWLLIALIDIIYIVWVS